MDPQLLTEVRRLTAAEDEAQLAARERAASGAPSPEVGALLAWTAATTAAATAVEVGSASGVSGLWLTRGMAPRGTLTSVEPDAHAHGLATAAYQEAGRTRQVRAIQGEPGTVLPRLSDGGYDLVLLQRPDEPCAELLEHARRLLRPGGALIVRHALQRGANAEEQAACLQQLSQDEGLLATVLPVDDGVALATRLDDEAS